MLTDADLQAHWRLGISATVLHAAGLARVTDAQARALLGVSRPHGDCAGIVYPRLSPLTGRPVSYRVRRDHPEMEEDRPKNKYLSSIDHLHLYFPAGCGPRLTAASQLVILVEAEKSVLALMSVAERTGQSWLVIGTGGCWGWRGRIGRTGAADGARVSETGPSPDFQLVTWSGRRVLILFDGATPSPPVRTARRALQDLLTSYGARVTQAYLPASDRINGPDDAVAAYGDGPMVALIEAALRQPLGSAGRSLHVTAASAIAPRPVHWLWDGRMAMGALTLLGGREGIGKSLAAYTLAASITRGVLPGRFAGVPRSVVIVATEDSWEHTIVPRLMGAGADLDRILRVTVDTTGGDDQVTLPADLTALREIVETHAVALILLDPLMSRLAARLDTHKDADVRRALEPLVALAQETGASVLGLIHVSKSQSSDPLTVLMASRAFAAVARSVLFVAEDPEDPQRPPQRLLGLAKNNLGALDLPSLAFRISSVCVAETDEGDVWTGRLTWVGETDRSIRDVLQASAAQLSEEGPVRLECVAWLEDYLREHDGAAEAGPIKTAGQRAGYGARLIQQARLALQLQTIRIGYPARSVWRLPTTPAPDADTLTV